MYLVVLFFFVFFFKKQNVILGKKVNEPRKWHRGVVWVFFGSSEISCSSWWFSEVVGEINHVATETEIEVGWVKVKKSYLILQVGKWKGVERYGMSFAEKKKFHVVWYLRPYCIVLEVSSAGTFENFSRCFAGFFGFFLFCFLFCATWKVVCLQFRMFLLFFFFFLKFLVGMSSLFWVFIVHVFGVHQCGVWRFFTSKSPMWCLKVFSVEVTNVGFEGI